MSESEIITILGKFNAEMLLLALFVSIVTGVLKKYIPSSLKNLIPLMPFILGIAVYFAYAFLVLKSFSVSEFLTKGVQLGGVATLIYALIKQISRKSSNSKNAVTDILTGFVDEATIAGTVSRILKEYSASLSNSQSIKTITKIIAENSTVGETESATLGNLVVKTLDTLNKKTTNTTK